ncbi:40514_t:CDS:2, partial [Gigaspora margarita]
ISDIYYNPWIDLNFDQNNQQSELDALPIKEIPIEPEAVQLELLQPQDTENIEDTQDPWEIFEENIVASGQAQGYPNDEYQINGSLILMKKASIQLFTSQEANLLQVSNPKTIQAIPASWLQQRFFSNKASTIGQAKK